MSSLFSTAATSRGGAGRRVEMMARLESSGALQRVAETLPRLLERMEMLHDLLGAVDRAVAATRRGPRPAGGLAGLWALARDADNQEGLCFLINLAKEMRRS